MIFTYQKNSIMPDRRIILKKTTIASVPPVALSSLTFEIRFCKGEYTLGKDMFL